LSAAFLVIFFFFSSRRRHTRLQGDWSSDVCSSDLTKTGVPTAGAIHNAGGTPVFVDIEADTFNIDPEKVEAAITPRTRAIVPVRSEERRVGKEGRSRWSPYH